MSYQVLARKWRPRTFREMVGQEHVLQALINALDHDRLHHAYLFTGTRGVGKTTIARILAKCINCEVGVSSVPCNECSACTEINEGRFVDLIEVDAASRTKVEDTRELLENVQYAPTRGRYKVYLIDEVHMLSNSSFNALLKTLEEPPPHVKFLLATTDPQKLPVTILSRCLQFNLKNMNPERIVSHLQFVLEKETVPFDEASLWQLARSADGSMRDALSLTDQAIAFGEGKIADADVRTMLGTIDQTLVYDVLNGLIAEDVAAVLKAVEDLSEHSPDYSAALAELIAILHRIAIAQALPEAVDNSIGDRQQVYAFAQSMTAEDVQLYYQTALLGRRDLPLVPDPRSGFEMVLLRMLAFKPQGVSQLPKKVLSASAPNSDPAPTPASIPVPIPAPTAEQPSESLSEVAPPMMAKPELEGNEPQSNEPQPQAGNLHPQEIHDNSEAENMLGAQHHGENGVENEGGHADASEANRGEEPVKKPETAIEVAEDRPSFIESMYAQAMEESGSTASNVSTVSKVSTDDEIPPHHNTYHEEQPVEPLASAEKSAEKISYAALTSDNWFKVYDGIDTGGLLQSTVANCQLIQCNEQTIEFILDEHQSSLYDDKHQQQLADLLTQYFSQPLSVIITVGTVTGETPSQRVIRLQQERLNLAEQVINSDPVVKQLQDIFDASIITDSIKPVS